MKKLSLILVLPLVVGAALAADKKDPKTIRCAVMPESKVDIAAATKKKMFADYKGRRYFFCCAGCPDEFKAHPEKYKKGDSIPTPKAPKKK